MRSITGWGRLVLVAGVMSLIGAAAARAEIHSDRAAAIVTYPLVRGFAIEASNGTVVEDTVIQLSNTSNEAVAVHCFYENANSHCSNNGTVCLRAIDCCTSASGCGTCNPDWNEIDFSLRLTPNQPVGWRAIEGLVDFPLDGVTREGKNKTDNSGSRVPPLPETPFIGELKCIAVDGVTHVPVARNVLKGEATIELGVEIFGGAMEGVDVAINGVDIGVHGGAGGGAQAAPPPVTRFVDAAKYNAIGIPAIPDGVNDDNTLVLGGPNAEYGGCPSVLIVDHFFDGAVNPVSGLQSVTQVALMPCTQDLLRQIPGNAVVQYLVFNEFEQRFSTSRSVECQQYIPLSSIDTTQPERSIFSAGVSGTLTGQTRLQPVGSGLVGVAIEGYGVVTVTVDNHLVLDRPIFTAGFNVQYQGERETPDLITLP